MDPVSAVLINRALDGLTARSMATAQNIANANSPGYRPLRVTFEEALRDAAPRGPAALRQVAPRFETDPAREPGAELRIDLELATASETAARYAALIDLMNRQVQLSRTLIRGGQ
ncbi:flagellar basal body rod protein FlgB [Sphingosinicella sp.]|uniref:flagellar basal body rod protein FlgB n=1 Tax=Sphingosinicella sp. TaxID=1917971 RepID=UPI0040381F44